MKTHRGMALLTALLMFPQIVETFYSPALTDIAGYFAVSAQDASWTLSIYFPGFALGVLVWGRVCDLAGRKPALLLGLACYAVGSVLALLAHDFRLLLAARVIAAFGAASGSVVTQTILRDRFSGQTLAKIFAFMGIALAVSPAIGLWAGGMLVSWGGFRGVFDALVALALLLFIWSAWRLEETRSAQHQSQPIASVAVRMLKDMQIWRATALVALFNVSLFSYYGLAPFMFERFGMEPGTFGLSGVLLALGSLAGAQLNHQLIQRGTSSATLLRLACICGLIGSLGVGLLSASPWFLAPMFMVMLAFSMAIPVVLGTALSAYSDCRGTAGALFGLVYYVLIGAGLFVAGWGQRLDMTLIVCAVGITLIGWKHLRR
ncbi:multidrug effflux MFS transporter [Cedecea sp. MMO-103]|uniref:multidrug effflux MFS transporter n=1 Tax=Cedecea sp. MMO-103 TaxID=3081238 RepID=UPI003FA525CD